MTEPEAQEHPGQKPEAQGASARPRLRRRQWIIDLPFQGWQMLYLLLVAGSVVPVTMFATAWLFVAMISPPGESVFLGRDPILAGAFCLALLVGFPLLAVWLSHRVAGPAFHFRKAMGQVKDGETGVRVKLRRHDQMKDMAESFNEMLDSLEQASEGASARAGQAREAVQAAMGALEAGEAPDLKEIRRLLEQANAALGNPST